MAFGAGWLGGVWASRQAAPPAPAAPVAVAGEPAGAQAAAAALVAPAVVCIDLRGTGEGAEGDALNGAHGSGVILSAEGLIVTNHHVIRSARRLEVTLPGEEVPYPARVLGSDPMADLALLQLEKLESDRKLPFLRFGDSDACRVGDSLIAVGNPYGVGHTVTVGVLSGRGKRLPHPGASPLTDLLQTDAAINPGNSGGALANLRGEVIGINTAIIPYAQGLGFAVPSNTAAWVVEQLKAQGKVVRAYLGIELRALSAEGARVLELPKGSAALVIRRVLPASPAEKAGLREGDALLEVDDQPVGSADATAAGLSRHTPGQTVKLMVHSQGQTRSLTVRLDTMPATLPGK